MLYLVVFLPVSIAVCANLSSAVTSSGVAYRVFLKDVGTAALAPRAFSLTQIKAKDHHKFIPKLFHVPAQPPSLPPFLTPPPVFAPLPLGMFFLLAFLLNLLY